MTLVDIILNIVLVIEGLFVASLARKLARPVYNYLRRPSPDISTDKFGTDDYVACYSVGDATIYLSLQVNEKNIYPILEHEYLHWILFKRVSKRAFEELDSKRITSYIMWGIVI